MNRRDFIVLATSGAAVAFLPCPSTPPQSVEAQARIASMHDAFENACVPLDDGYYSFVVNQKTFQTLQREGLLQPGNRFEGADVVVVVMPTGQWTTVPYDSVDDSELPFATQARYQP